VATAATTNTPFYRLHHPLAVQTHVLNWLVHGCPIPAIVAALGLDERTVRAWLGRGGAHAALLHDQEVTPAGGVPAHPVQADEMRVRVRGGMVWAAVAGAVDSRVWLTSAVARCRAGLLVHLLLGRAFLLAEVGFGAYVTAARALVRAPHPVSRIALTPTREGYRMTTVPCSCTIL